MEESQKFGEVICPLIEEKDVPSLIDKCYGLKSKCVKKLNGYDDKNYFIEVHPEIRNPHIKEISSTGYIFKILNSRDSKCPKVIEGQNLIMQYLSNNISLPTLQKNVHGNYLSQEIISVSEGEKGKPKYHIVRLLSYIPGKLMSDVEYTVQLLFDVGKLTGKLNNILKDFHNKAIQEREYIWQLKYLPKLTDYLHAVKDVAKLELIKDVLAAWKSVVIPVIPTLEKVIIHGDLNEQNILVRSDSNDPSVSHICGLLDLGDVNYSPCIFELGICVAYVVFEVDSLDISEAAGHVIAGYQTERLISNKEWNILVECVAGRIAQSLVLGAYSYTLDPGNEYLLGTAKKGWKRLEALWSVPKNELIEQWKTISSSYCSLNSTNVL